MAVVKADAYGHGAVRLARRLRREGVKAFAVACAAEGITLRKHGVGGQILILGYTPTSQAAVLARWRLTQTVADEAHGRALNDQGVPLHVHLALDTGMHRLGIPARDHAAIARMYQLSNLKIQGGFSNLCVSDSTSPEDTTYTENQVETFYETIRWMRENGWEPGETHIQESYGIWNLPPQPCSWARAGIALYGVSSDTTPTRLQLDLRPALALRARIASVHTLQLGERAGYGLAFQLERETKLAVVTIGYADGLPWSLSRQGGQVLIAGQRCPMVGRMCMDQLLVDVTDVTEAAVGMVVTLIGRDGQVEIRAEEVAEQCGTIANELLSRMGARLPVVMTDAKRMDAT